MAQHNEIEFENEICSHLADHGWLYSPTDDGYDRELALFPEDVLGWLADTQPVQLAKRVAPESASANNPAAKVLLKRLSQSLTADLKAGGGTLAVLRHGFKDVAASFQMCQFKPNTGLNSSTSAMYGAVRLRVMRQVHYSTTAPKKSIDLVFFVNGIPVATAELKTDFTQSVKDAVTQYKTARLPKGEPLLQFGSSALVHFAVSNNAIEMTTKLAGDATYFLPFNRGNNHHAGNPPNENGSSPTAYLWETVLQKDTWLDILGRFMHLQVTDTFDPVTSKKSRKQTMLFPRYHQWEAVTQLIQSARTEGPGQKYLVQHSAGSGKTNSISWLAQRLANLHNDVDKKVFDSVIVVTDRTVLDSQLQESINQMETRSGVVAHIDGLGGSKSQLLAQALESGTNIIIVTIQTFPYALDAINDRSSLKGKSFAIIADEAHSSQAGEASKKLKSVLSAAELAEIVDGGAFDAEDVLAAETAARAAAKNISFFAFTATPKEKTLQLFGRQGSDGKPEPFHLYSMQQAIDEGFILDVLRNYTPYKTAFRLSHNGSTYSTDESVNGGTVAITGSEDTKNLVDKSAAIKSVMNWVKLHPTNIAQKVQIIVEHFRANVAWRLDGQAKAMVVTSSRKAAVRYKKAFDAYVAEKGYTDVAALVAFSGEVIDTESGADPFTETNSNPGLKGRDLRDAFDTDDYQVMLVANKFQTGFDQPKLVAMYVDKKLSGVAAVQTLSRLNRIYPPKKDQTFVLDFTNAVADIVDAFSPYYEVTTLADVTDPNIVHNTERKISVVGIYEKSEVNGLVNDYLAKKGNNALAHWIKPAVDRHDVRQREAFEAGDTVALEELIMFRKDISTYIKQYDFLSQLFDYEDPWLEKLSIYLKHLAPQLTERVQTDPIDLSTVQIDYIDQLGQEKTDGKLSGGTELQPSNAAGTGVARDPEMVAMSEIIEKLNDLFSGEHSAASIKNVITHVRDKLIESEPLKQQAQANSLAQFSASAQLQNEFVTAVLGAMESSADLSKQILNNADLAQKLLGELLPGIYRTHTKGSASEDK